MLLAEADSRDFRERVCFWCCLLIRLDRGNVVGGAASGVVAFGLLWSGGAIGTLISVPLVAVVVTGAVATLRIGLVVASGVVPVAGTLRTGWSGPVCDWTGGCFMLSQFLF
jgi:hypothetical protein